MGLLRGEVGLLSKRKHRQQWKRSQNPLKAFLIHVGDGTPRPFHVLRRLSIRLALRLSLSSPGRAHPVLSSLPTVKRTSKNWISAGPASGPGTWLVRETRLNMSRLACDDLQSIKRIGHRRPIYPSEQLQAGLSKLQLDNYSLLISS
jgi:hypothetical protein